MYSIIPIKFLLYILLSYMFRNYYLENQNRQYLIEFLENIFTELYLYIADNYSEHYTIMFIISA